MRAGFPFPRCPTCGEQSICRAHGEGRPEYPRCHRPLLGTSLERVRALVAWWSRFHACADPRLAALEEALLARLAADRWRYSEVFEPSWSHDAGGWHFWRFSYAFPGFRAAGDADRAALLDFCRPFGERARGWADALLAPAGEPAVVLPLVGLAYDGATSWRLKLYWQFADGAGDDALRIARRLTGRADLTRLFRGRALHLIGIDLGPGGIAGAKLYFQHSRLTPDERRRVVGSLPLLDALPLAAPLRNALVIHRLRRADDPALATPAEVDFALAENELRWEDLADLPAVRRLRAPGAPGAALEAAFPLAVRRVSFPVGGDDKLNVYYVPTEVDAAAPATG